MRSLLVVLFIFSTAGAFLEDLEALKGENPYISLDNVNKCTLTAEDPVIQSSEKDNVCFDVTEAVFEKYGNFYRKKILITLPKNGLSCDAYKFGVSGTIEKRRKTCFKTSADNAYMSSDPKNSFWNATTYSGLCKLRRGTTIGEIRNSYNYYYHDQMKRAFVLCYDGTKDFNIMFQKHPAMAADKSLEIWAQSKPCEATVYGPSGTVYIKKGICLDGTTMTGDII